MIDILAVRMNAENFTEFCRDYKELLKAKSNKDNWRQAMQSRKNIAKEPYLKRIYERLDYSYNYIGYKQAIYNTNLKVYIQNNKALALFYTIGTYIGHIVEQSIADELAALDVKIEQSFVLDNVFKTDIKAANICYQVKNISYLNYKPQLNEYAANDVQFIFYVLKDDNIYFVADKERITHTAADVEQMQSYGIYKYITAEQLINELAQRG